MADKVNLYTAGLLASHIDVNGQGDKFLSNNGEYKTADIEIDKIEWQDTNYIDTVNFSPMYKLSEAFEVTSNDYWTYDNYCGSSAELYGEQILLLNFGANAYFDNNNYVDNPLTGKGYLKYMNTKETIPCNVGGFYKLEITYRISAPTEGGFKFCLSLGSNIFGESRNYFYSGADASVWRTENIIIPIEKEQTNKQFTVFIRGYCSNNKHQVDNMEIEIKNISLYYGEYGDKVSLSEIIKIDKGSSTFLAGDGVYREPSTNVYTLPTATKDKLGGIKIGEGTEISEDGTLTVKNSINDNNISDNSTYSSKKINDTYVQKETNKSLVENTEITKIHEHKNKAYLDKITEDENGKPLYNGESFGNKSPIDDSKISIDTTYSSNKIDETYVTKENGKSLVLDTEINKIHNHLNKSILDKLSEDENGKPVYNNKSLEYTLPPATKNLLGGVKVGDNLTITEDGTLSCNNKSNYLIVNTVNERDSLEAVEGMLCYVNQVQIKNNVKVGDNLKGRTIYVDNFNDLEKMIQAFNNDIDYKLESKESSSHLIGSTTEWDYSDKDNPFHYKVYYFYFYEGLSESIKLNICKIKNGTTDLTWYNTSFEIPADCTITVCDTNNYFTKNLYYYSSKPILYKYISGKWEVFLDKSLINGNIILDGQETQIYAPYIIDSTTKYDNSAKTITLDKTNYSQIIDFTVGWDNSNKTFYDIVLDEDLKDCSDNYLFKGLCKCSGAYGEIGDNLPSYFNVVDRGNDITKTIYCNFTPIVGGDIYFLFDKKGDFAELNTTRSVYYNLENLKDMSDNSILVNSVQDLQKTGKLWMGKLNPTLTDILTEDGQQFIQVDHLTGTNGYLKAVNGVLNFKAPYSGTYAFRGRVNFAGTTSNGKLIINIGSGYLIKETNINTDGGDTRLLYINITLTQGQVLAINLDSSSTIPVSNVFFEIERYV